jgi:hypothetical protein
MKKSLLVISVFLSALNFLSAQHLSTLKGQSSLGIGVGLPYGGIGMKLGYNTSDHVTFFGGLGYNMVGIGANGGIQLSIPSEKQSEFYFTGMYGYNAVIISKDRSAMGEIFAGPSFGVGLKINSVSTRGNFWDVGLLGPVRSPKYKNAIQEIERSRNMRLESKPWPVLFYFGYNYNISKE